MKRKEYNKIKTRRERRVRERIIGTLERPRLSVFRSNKFTSAQLIDDVNGKTIISASSREDVSKKQNKIAGAQYVGKVIAERAKKEGVLKAVLDRGSYRYHGRVKTLVESARENGLQI